MKISNQYSHLDAIGIIQGKQDIYNEIKNILNSNELKIERGNSIKLNKEIDTLFNSYGWGDKIKVGTGKSGLRISFLKSRVGLCFQFGNVSRTYADILKLCFLGNQNVIDSGIIVVPHSLESKMLGVNYAKYDRLEREMKLFNTIIKTPILIICVSN
jgi:hypothetical protein